MNKCALAEMKKYLPDKGCVFLVFEILRKNLSFELGQIMDNESIAIVVPGDDMVQVRSLHNWDSYLQDAVSVADECGGVFLFFHLF